MQGVGDQDFQQTIDDLGSTSLRCCGSGLDFRALLLFYFHALQRRGGDKTPVSKQIAKRRPTAGTHRSCSRLAARCTATAPGSWLVSGYLGLMGNHLVLYTCRVYSRYIKLPGLRVRTRGPWFYECFKHTSSGACGGTSHSSSSEPGSSCLCKVCLNMRI